MVDYAAMSLNVVMQAMQLDLQAVQVQMCVTVANGGMTAQWEAPVNLDVDLGPIPALCIFTPCTFMTYSWGPRHVRAPSLTAAVVGAGGMLILAMLANGGAQTVGYVGIIRANYVAPVDLDVACNMNFDLGGLDLGGADFKGLLHEPHLHGACS